MDRGPIARSLPRSGQRGSAQGVVNAMERAWHEARWAVSGRRGPPMTRGRLMCGRWRCERVDRVFGAQAFLQCAADEPLQAGAELFGGERGVIGVTRVHGFPLRRRILWGASSGHRQHKGFSTQWLRGEFEVLGQDRLFDGPFICCGCVHASGMPSTAGIVTAKPPRRRRRQPRGPRFRCPGPSARNGPPKSGETGGERRQERTGWASDLPAGVDSGDA